VAVKRPGERISSITRYHKTGMIDKSSVLCDLKTLGGARQENVTELTTRTTVGGSKKRGRMLNM